MTSMGIAAVCHLNYGLIFQQTQRREGRCINMQISSRFTLAVHILTCIAVIKEMKVTSNLLAGSTNTNPVIVRKILGQLKNAGLVEVARGTGGASLAKPADEINFFDIYQAVECINKGELFHFHENPNEQCPIGHNIHAVLDDKLEQVQRTMEQKLASISLADVQREILQYINAETTKK